MNRWFLAVVAFAPILLPGLVEAQIVLHVMPAAGPEPSCANAPASIGCAWRQSSVNAVGPLGVDLDVYAIAISQTGEQGIAEARFSLDYDEASGVGVDILQWSACGNEVLTESGWPLPGSMITIRFDPVDNCQATVPDSTGAYAQAVLAVFRVHAYTDDGLQIDGDSQGRFGLVTCTGQELALSVGLAYAGEAGFGAAPSNDPCLFDLYSHACFAFPWLGGCYCCMPDSTCRGIAFYFDGRNCRDEGGRPIETCVICAVAVAPATWGSIKSRFGPVRRPGRK